jgi:hypothetical protein
MFSGGHKRKRASHNDEPIGRVIKRRKVVKKKFTGDIPNTLWKKRDLVCNRFYPLTKQEDYTYPSQMIQGAKEWDAIRKNMYTGSIIAGILGYFEPKTIKILGLPAYYYDPGRCRKKWAFHTKKDIKFKYVDDTSKIPEPKPDDTVVYQVPLQDITKIRFRWGHEHEDTAIQHFLSIYTGIEIYDTGIWTVKDIYAPTQNAPLDPQGRRFLEEIIANTSLPKIGASPDGIGIENGERVNIEVKCKCVFQDERKEELRGTNGKYLYRKAKPHIDIPDYYFTQIQFEMMMSMTRKTYFISWTPTGGMHVFIIYINEDFCREILHFIKRFDDDFVKTGKQPHLNFFNEDTRYMTLLNMAKKLKKEVALPLFYKNETYGGGDIFSQSPI